MTSFSFGNAWQSLSSRDESFAGLLNRSSTVAGQKSVIRLSRDDAERLRARLTEHLAKVGFDKNYALKPEGEILEELIDQFYHSKK